MKLVDVFFVEVSHENILGCGSYRALVPPVDTDLAGGLGRWRTYFSNHTVGAGAHHCHQYHDDAVYAAMRRRATMGSPPIHGGLGGRGNVHGLGTAVACGPRSPLGRGMPAPPGTINAQPQPCSPGRQMGHGAPEPVPQAGMSQGAGGTRRKRKG